MFSKPTEVLVGLEKRPASIQLKTVPCEIGGHFPFYAIARQRRKALAVTFQPSFDEVLVRWSSVGPAPVYSEAAAILSKRERSFFSCIFLILLTCSGDIFTRASRVRRALPPQSSEPYGRGLRNLGHGSPPRSICSAPIRPRSARRSVLY